MICVSFDDFAPYIGTLVLLPESIISFQKSRKLPPLTFRNLQAGIRFQESRSLAPLTFKNSEIPS